MEICIGFDNKLTALGFEMEACSMVYIESDRLVGYIDIDSMFVVVD